MKENKMGNHFQNIVNQCLLSAARQKIFFANLTSAGLLLLLNEIIPWNFSSYSPPPPQKKNKKSKY